MIYLTGTGQVTHAFASLSVSEVPPPGDSSERGKLFSGSLKLPALLEKWHSSCSEHIYFSVKSVLVNKQWNRK